MSDKKSMFYCTVCGKTLTKPCKHWKDINPDSTKDLTTEELVEIKTNEMEQLCMQSNTRDDRELLIRKLIEQKPTVPKEFVEKWVEKGWEFDWDNELMQQIKQMLKEAGVEVSK